MTEPLPAVTLDRMLIAIIGGEVPKANNAAERELRDDLTRQVAKISSRGWIVDIPSDWPEL